MCRIILALGKFDPAQLVQGMLLMAEDKNSIHELNQRLGQGTWQHPDGWGIAYLQDNQWVIEKSTKAIYKDKKINHFKKLKTDFALLHARKQSVGNVSLRNTHPFQHKNFVFCHNGRIRNEFEEIPGFQQAGETDSEKLFHDLLSQLPTKSIPQAIRHSFKSYPDCKGTNIVLATPTTTFVAVRKNTLPDYYGMQIGLQPDALIISSEKIPSLKNIQWQPLQQGEILEINNIDLTYKIH